MKDAPPIPCRQCGTCCHVDMIAYITVSDMRRWEKEQRFDIISHLSGTEIIWCGDIIMTGSGIHIQSCTFLDYDGKVFFCSIYETRPQVCRDYIPGSSALCPLYPGHK